MDNIPRFERGDFGGSNPFRGTIIYELFYLFVVFIINLILWKLKYVLNVIWKRM